MYALLRFKFIIKSPLPKVQYPRPPEGELATNCILKY
jgi:hypothetical protein